MFFTNFGRAIAWLATILGIISVVAGFEIDIKQAESVVADMLNVNANQWNGKQGKVLREQGFAVLFCGVILGVLCDISRSVANKAEIQEEQVR